MHALVVAAALLVPTVQSAVVTPGDPVVVSVARPAAANARVYLVDSAGIRRPVATLRRGATRVRFAFPPLPVDVYVPALRVAAGPVARGNGVLRVRALPPAGFGALGAMGCAPASPRNVTAGGFAATEVFGTAVGAQFWALGASTPAGDSASLAGVVGQQEKIIFRMTSGVPSVFYAVAPDGTRVPPLWGPSPHLGSNWDRPGREWGAGFVFTSPGCWQIHAQSGAAQGDLWIAVAS
jgi:hypothetical protein